MINQGNNVPDKTIAVFMDERQNFSFEHFSNIVQKPKRKRDWFSPHFYHCLPLAIANQYGFVISSEYDFEFEWDGREHADGVKIYINEEDKAENLYPKIVSHFGSGIITLEVPFMLRTPSGINLMTINPPNEVIPNITVMNGIIESDNIRYSFTFNLRIQIPGIKVKILKGTPLAGFIPIPRYFADEFTLVDADTIFDEKTVIEENQAFIDNRLSRTESSDDSLDRLYFNGKDIYENKFPDHQKP